MDTIIAPSVSSVVVTPNGEDQWNFAESAQRASSRQAKGLTRERVFLNRQKLIASCCADYRAHFAAVYGKTERLPSVIFERIETAVDELIAKNLRAINPCNAVSLRRAFAHKANDMKFVERVTAVGENEITLQEQHCGCVIALEQAKRRLIELEKKPNPDYEREKQVKQSIMKLELTKSFIEGEIAHQKTVLPTA